MATANSTTRTLQTQAPAWHAVVPKMFYVTETPLPGVLVNGIQARKVLTVCANADDGTCLGCECSLVGRCHSVEHDGTTTFGVVDEVVLYH